MSTSSFYGNNPTPTEYRDIDELIKQAEDAANTALTAGQNAEDDAALAETYKNQAASSAAASASSASDAANSASSANTAKVDAQTAQIAAANSASASLTSANNSAASANSASSSATASSVSASNAASSASAASASQIAAASSQTAAAASQSAAATSASAASASQSAAATSAANAATSETNAAAYELSANNWATKTSGPVAGSEYSAKYHAQAAASSASGAASSASAASSSASTASTASTAASAAQVAAEAARDQTLASFDSFDDRYLGAKTSDPTLDNDGNALVAGSLYFNSIDGAMKVYTGSVWVDAYAAGTMFVQKAGSTMTGPLVLYGNAANALEAVPKQQLDARFVNPAFTGKATFEASVATGAKVNLGAGANVTSNLVDGDIWIENANLRWQGNGTTYRASAVGHTHTISNITSLQTTLDAKVNVTDTTYVKQDSTSGSAYLPAGTTAQRPASPAAGYIRYNSTTGKFEGFGSAWGNIGGGAAIGDTPPANPGAGDLWWNSADGRMYVYYTDANSSQWVDLSAGGAGQYLPLTGGDVTGQITLTGNLGVGTTSISSYGTNITTVDVRGSAGSGIKFGTSANSGMYYNGGNAYVQTFDSSPLILATNNVERVRVDTSGRVTMPFQPAFSVTGPYSGNINPISVAAGGGFVVLWQGVFLNVGSCYSTSTGRFTAPIAGRYVFHASASASAAYGGPYLAIRVNGSLQAASMAICYSSTGYSRGAATIIVSLAANDYVDTYFGAYNVTSAIDLSYSSFSGHLLS